MTPEELKARTKALSLRTLNLANAIPRNAAGQIITRQIVRSATSVGANYRAACRAQSRSVFAAKLAIVSEEADETLYWLELLAESGLIPASRLRALMKETEEILAIVTASRKTVKRAAGTR
ncbi:MAG: four helix bundle protein [Deltaproteobacteria bacterium]